MSNYWAERQKQLNNQLEKDEKKLKEKLSAEYEKEAKKLEKEIAAYYKTYGEADVIEYRTLLQSLSSADRQLLMERMDDFAAKYPQYAHLMPVRESIYKLDRLEGLQASIRMQQLQIGAVENDLISNHLLKTAQRGANNAAEAMGFGKNFYSLNSEILKTTINKGWTDEKNFSDRIWDNRQKLADYLCNDFASAIVRGDSYQKCVNELTDRFVNVSKNNAFRLVYTEGTYISNESQSQVFEEYYEQYRFNTIDGNACKNCKGINQKVFDFKDRKPGLNFPPLHAWCRCYFTVEIEDSEKWMDDYVAKKQGETVEKSAESGIIEENSKKPITKITDKAIKRVPNVEIVGYTKEQCNEIQRQHRELLKYSRDKNESKEVAFVFRKNLSDKTKFFGKDDKLNFGTGLLGKGYDLIVMHNHPRNSSYSATDLVLFRDYKDVKTLTIVKNNGNVEYITKSENYDSQKFKLEYDRLYRKIVINNTDSENDKFVKTLLNKTKSGVIWSEKK